MHRIKTLQNNYLSPIYPYVLSLLLFFSLHNATEALPPATPKWSIGAEWHYLLPTLDDTYFLNSNIEEEEYSLNYIVYPVLFNFRSAYSLKGHYRCAANEPALHLTYTHLCADTQQVFSGSALSAIALPQYFFTPAIGYDGTASAAVHLTYNCVEALWSQCISSCAWSSLELQGGISYVYLGFQESYNYRKSVSYITESALSQQVRLQGVGPQLGGSLHYEVALPPSLSSGSLYLTLQGKGGLLSSLCKTGPWNTKTTGQLPRDIILASQTIWRLVPFGAYRLGITCRDRISCFCVTLETGYEWIVYPKALANLPVWDTLFMNDLYSPLTDYRTVGMQGFYASLSLSF